MLDNISNKELNLSNIAIDIALQSNQHYKLGCLIIKNGKVVCKNFNDKRSRINKKNFVCIHAEVNSIHNLLKIEKNQRKLKNYTLLVLRIGKDKNGDIALRNAKPCKFCTESIKKIGLKKIIYSNDDGNLEKVKLNELESNYVSRGYDRMKCIEIKSY